MKLSKSDIQKLSKFFGWSYGDTIKAIEDTRELNLPVNPDEILKLCIESDGKQKRENALKICLINSMKGDKLEYISNLMLDEDIFYICTLFTVFEYTESKGQKISFEYSETRDTKYARFSPFYISSELCDKDGNLLVSYSHSRQWMKLLKYHCINFLLMNYLFKDKYRNGFDKDYYNELFENTIIELISRAGLQIFEIWIIRHYLTDMQQNLDDNDFEQRVLDKLSDPLRNRNLNTQKQYWLILCLVDTLKEKNYRTMEAFETSAKLLKMNMGTVRRRYYEIKAKQLKQKREINDIIKEEGLRGTLLKLLKII